MAQAELSILIRARDEASQMLRDLNKEIDANRKAWQSDYAQVADYAKKAGVAMVASGAAITGAFALAIKGAADEQVGIERLSVAMQNVGLSYDDSRESLERWIKAQQDSTAFADGEQTRSAKLVSRTDSRLVESARAVDALDGLSALEEYRLVNER